MNSGPTEAFSGAREDPDHYAIFETFYLGGATVLIFEAAMDPFCGWGMYLFNEVLPNLPEREE